MKQRITKEQWEELSDEEKIKYHETMPDMFALGGYPTIGQMIMFLGEDFCSIERVFKTVEKSQLEVRIYNEKIDEYKALQNKELCDLLWDAVKYKLK